MKKSVEGARAWSFSRIVRAHRKKFAIAVSGTLSIGFAFTIAVDLSKNYITKNIKETIYESADSIPAPLIIFPDSLLTSDDINRFVASVAEFDSLQKVWIESWDKRFRR